MNRGTIFDPIRGNQYEGTICADSADCGRFLDLFNGTPRRATWEPLRVERFAEGRARRPADFPTMAVGDVLVMRESAAEALRDMFEAGGELLPLATGDDVPLFILNVTRVIDALDEDRADVLRFPDGRIAYLNAPAFHADKVRDVDFFKLAGRRSEIFVGERFVARVREAKLVGLEFRPVWSPAGGPIRRRLNWREQG